MQLDFERTWWRACRCVPGWAYKEGAACMELTEHDLAASASLQVQQQFYHETGTKVKGARTSCSINVS